MSDANQDQRPPARPSGRDGGRGVRLALVAVLAAASAVVGALLVCLALWATGNLGGTRLVVRADGTDQVAHSIDVITTQEDTTIPEAVAAKAMPSVVLVEVSYDRSGSIGSTGSGVIYDDEGNIITNYHVIEGGESISISYDGQSYDAEVVGSDPSSDLAVLHVDFGDQEVTPIERGDSDQLIVGDWVMAVGHPYGLDQSASQGIVSALYSSTMLSSASGNTLYTNLIQTDAAVNPGNSGGALVNDQGQLVGITTLNATADEGGANAGVAFAIPGNYAMEIADTIIAGDEVEHAYVGVSVQTVNATNAGTATVLQSLNTVFILAATCLMARRLRRRRDAGRARRGGRPARGRRDRGRQRRGDRLRRRPHPRDPFPRDRRRRGAHRVPRLRGAELRGDAGLRRRHADAERLLAGLGAGTSGVPPPATCDTRPGAPRRRPAARIDAPWGYTWIPPWGMFGTNGGDVGDGRPAWTRLAHAT